METATSHSRMDFSMESDYSSAEEEGHDEPPVEEVPPPPPPGVLLNALDLPIDPNFKINVGDLFAGMPHIREAVDKLRLPHEQVKWGPANNKSGFVGCVGAFTGKEWDRNACSFEVRHSQVNKVGDDKGKLRITVSSTSHTCFFAQVVVHTKQLASRPEVHKFIWALKKQPPVHDEMERVCGQVLTSTLFSPLDSNQTRS